MKASAHFALESALSVLCFLHLPPLFIFPFLLTNEGSQHMTLTRSEVHLRQRCVGVLVPQVNEVEDQLWVQNQWHITAFGSSGPLLSVSDDFGKLLIISFVVIGRYLEGDMFLLRTWSSASS